MASVHTHGTAAPTLPQKLLRLNWSLVLLITLVAVVGFAMQYSVADGSVDPWARRQMIRFAVSFCGMLVVAMVDIRFWRGSAYIFYGPVARFARRGGSGRVGGHGRAALDRHRPDPASAIRADEDRAGRRAGPGISTISTPGKCATSSPSSRPS